MEKGNILIVEDESLVALDLKRELESAGHRVCAIATSAEEVLAISEQPDLMIMDIRLSGVMDGVDAAARLKDRFPQIPIIYLTAYVDDHTVERAAVTEPAGFITKPFRPAEVRAAIEVALYQSRQRLALNARSQRFNVKHVVQGQDRVSHVSLEDASFFEHLHLFQGLEQDEKRAVIAETKLSSLKPSEMLFAEGETYPPPFLVRQGKMALVKNSLDGKEFCLSLIFPHDASGLMSLADSAPCGYSARAQSQVEIALLPRKTLQSFLTQNQTFRRDFEKCLAAWIKESNRISQAIAYDSVEQRIATALLALVGRAMPPASTNSSEIWITRQELCALCACTVETAIRITRALEEQGVLDLSRRGRIRIRNAQELAQRSGPAWSRSPNPLAAM